MPTQYLTQVRRLIFWLLALNSPFVAAQDPSQLLREADRLAFLQDWSRAGPLYTEAEQLFAEAGDQRNALYSHIGKIYSHADTRRFPDLSAFLAAQLESPLVLVDLQLRLRCLVAKGEIDIETNPSQAHLVWNEVASVAKQLGEKAWETRAKAKLTFVAFMQGELDKAKQLGVEVYFSTLASSDVAVRTSINVALAAGMYEMKRYDEGWQFANEAQKLADSAEIGFPFSVYAVRAQLSAAVGKTQEAKVLLERNLDKSKLLQSRFHEANVLTMLGKLAASVGDFQTATQQLEAAASLCRDKGFHQTTAWSMFELAKVYQKTGDIAKAEKNAQQALQAMQIVRDRYHLPLHLALLAELEAQQGNASRADELYEQAADVAEAMLVNVPSTASRNGLLAVMSQVYEGHFSLCADRLKDTKRAFQVLERARGRTMADSLRISSVERDGRRPTTTDAAREIQIIQSELAYVSGRSERKQLLEKLWQAEIRHGLAADNVTRLREIAGHAEPVAMEALRASLKSDELFLEYVLHEPVSYCVVVSRESASIVSLTDRDTIQKLVGDYLGAVRERKPTAALGSRLYSLLLRPVSEFDRKARLIVVPDGSLHHLPFDALQNPQGKYVLQSHVVTYSPSATVLYLLRSAQSTPAQEKGFLGVGDVMYEGEAQAQLAQRVGPAQPKGNIARGFFDASGVKLQDLPHSRQEVLSVASTFGSAQVLLLGDKATEAHVKSQRLDQFGILHLAVHGAADPNHPERSALVLGSDSNSNEDGLLQAREISTLRLNARLVTLSACDTAVGRLEGQAGISNLAQSFLFAGARTVVATLWNINDAFTASLMKQFYQGLLTGQDPAKALQKAKLDLMGKFAQGSDPYYWASFVMVGASDR